MNSQFKTKKYLVICLLVLCFFLIVINTTNEVRELLIDEKYRLWCDNEISCEQIKVVTDNYPLSVKFKYFVSGIYGYLTYILPVVFVVSALTFISLNVMNFIKRRKLNNA